MDRIFTIYPLGPTDAGLIASAPDDPHVHDYEELILCLEGHLEHFIDFENTKIQAPCLAYVTRGKVHRVIPRAQNGKCRMWVVRFKSEFLPEFSLQLYALYHHQANTSLDDQDAVERMDRLCRLMHDSFILPDPDFNLLRHLLAALLRMAEIEKKRHIPQNGEQAEVRNSTILQFLSLLEAHYMRPEGVAFYADKLFMSARNLNLICKNTLNQTASELIENRKLTEARNQLIYTDKSVSEIGYELGFKERAYFTRVFKKRTGQTPTEFRNQMCNMLS